MDISDNSKLGIKIKPSLFVASSTEGLMLAGAVGNYLSDYVDVTLWNEGAFKAGNNFIDSLINQLARFDFALMILTADDLIEIRGEEMFSPRDNVIFELGLFMGSLGKSRTFIMCAKEGNIKIPTDLSGIHKLGFTWPRINENYLSAAREACYDLIGIIRDLGTLNSKTLHEVENIKHRQDLQQWQIRSLQTAFLGVVTQYEFDKLFGLSLDKPFLCYVWEKPWDELANLRAKGLIESIDNGLIAIKGFFHKSEQIDLKKYFRITHAGLEYLEIRKMLK